MSKKQIARNEKSMICKTILFCLLFFVVVNIPYLNTIGYWSDIQNFLQITVSAYLLARLVKRVKISNYNIVLILTLVSFVLSTAMNSGEVMGAIAESISIFSISLLVEMGLRENKEGLVRGAYYFYLTCSVVNLISILLFPDGLYRTSNLQYSTSLNWFLGYKNLHILFTHQLLFWGSILDIINKKRLSVRTIMAVTISILTAFLAGSTTSLIGLTLMIVLLLLDCCVKKTKKIHIGFLSAIYTLSFVSIIILRLQEKYDSLIFKITQKHSDFVGRSYIWDSVFGFIKERLLLGYGKENSLIRQAKTTKWQAAHAHNEILEILYRMGIIGALLVLILVGMSFRKLDEHKDKKVTRVITVIVFSMLVMMLTEYYAPQYFISLLTVSYNIGLLVTENAKVYESKKRV